MKSVVDMDPTIREHIGSIALLMSSWTAEQLAAEMVAARMNRHRDRRHFCFMLAVLSFREKVAAWQEDAEFIGEFDQALARVKDQTIGYYDDPNNEQRLPLAD